MTEPTSGADDASRVSGAPPEQRPGHPHPPATPPPIPGERPSAAPSHGGDGRGERRSGRERRVPWQPSHGWRSRDILRATLLVIGTYWGLRLLWFANPLFLTVFLGVLFGLAVSAGVDQLRRYRIPRAIGAVLIVGGFLALIIGFFAWSGPTLAEQSRELRERLPEALDRVDEWLERNRDGMLASILLGPEGSPPAAAEPLPPGAAAPSPAVEQQQELAGRLGPDPLAQGDTTVSATETLRGRILTQLGGVGRYLFPFISSTVAVVAGVVLVIFLAIYVAAEPRVYRNGLLHLFPHDTRERAAEVFAAIATVLRRWLVTQLIAMVVIGVVTTVVLLLLDVRAALPLGVLAGLLEFIPTIGPILSAVPAIAMGFVDSPEKALYVALAYWGIQFLENQLLIPILMREGVDIPPALTIGAQALMAILFGFLGLVVAVPMLAAGLVAVRMLYVRNTIGDDIEVFDAEPGQ